MKMKIIVISLLLFSSLFAWPTGTTKTMRIIVNSGQVTETSTTFLHQMDLSNSIVTIDAAIDSASQAAVCTSDKTTLVPKYIHYLPGSKFLLEFAGGKHTTANDTFYLCMGSDISAVNSTATYTNNNVKNYFRFTTFSGNTISDVVGSKTGTVVSPATIDTTTDNWGAVVFTSATATTTNIVTTNLSEMYNVNTTVESYANINYAASGSQQMIVGSTHEQLYLYGLGTNVVQAYLGSGYSSALSAPGNVDILVCATIANSTTFTLYVNTTTNTSQTLTNAAWGENISIGGAYGVGLNGFNGRIRHVLIYDAVKSSGYIADRYKALHDLTTFYTIGSISNVDSSKSIRGASFFFFK